MDLDDLYAHYLDAQEEEFLDRQRVKQNRRARRERRELERLRKEQNVRSQQTVL